MSALLSTKRSRLPRPRSVLSRVALRDMAGARASRSSSTRSTKRASASILRRALRIWPGNHVNAISGIDELLAEPIAEPDSKDAAHAAQDQRREREEIPTPQRRKVAPPPSRRPFRSTPGSSDPSITHAAGQDHTPGRYYTANVPGAGDEEPARAPEQGTSHQRHVFRAMAWRGVSARVLLGQIASGPARSVSRRYGWRGFCRFLLLCRFPKRSDVRGSDAPAAGAIDRAQLLSPSPVPGHRVEPAL